MRSTVAFLSLASLALATDAPSYSGWSLKWASIFPYDKGVLPDGPNHDNDKWNVISGWLGINNEVETYTKDPANIQNTGNQSMIITPLKDSNGKWTSGRIESKYTFMPTAGKKTRAEARIRFGNNPVDQQQGIWPAFWVIGQGCRDHTIDWPGCGEIDIMERINGQLIGHGTGHCSNVTNGGPCNEPIGLTKTVSIPNTDWHTWRVEWDRTPSDWKAETITWFLDGVQYNQIRGGQLQGQDPIPAKGWKAMTRYQMYFVVNVAIGGDFVSTYSYFCVAKSSCSKPLWKRSIC